MIEIGDNLALAILMVCATVCVVGVAWAGAYAKRKEDKE